MTNFYVGYSGGKARIYRNGSINKILYSTGGGATPTPTPTVGLTATSTPTATPTSTPTATPTSTPTVTLTATPTSTPTAAPSSFITLAYTAGSWSGVGTSASKYTTSSTFSPRPAGASSELLPFNFTATSNCEFYLKWSHYGVNDDNYRNQTTQILINGSPIDTDTLGFGNNGISTETQGFISNSVEYPIWLTTGDIVTVRVYRTAIDHFPVDTYTSVSAYAVARTTSPITLTRNVRGDPSWSGLGTLDSKYSMSGSFLTSYFSATLPNKKATFAIKKTGTFYCTATVSDYPDDNGDALDVYKNGLYSGQTFLEGTTAGTRSLAVSIGDIIELSGYGNATVSNLSVWVV